MLCFIGTMRKPGPGSSSYHKCGKRADFIAIDVCTILAEPSKVSSPAMPMRDNRQSCEPQCVYAFPAPVQEDTQRRRHSTARLSILRSSFPVRIVKLIT